MVKGNYKETDKPNKTEDSGGWEEFDWTQDIFGTADDVQQVGISKQDSPIKDNPIKGNPMYQGEPEALDIFATMDALPQEGAFKQKSPVKESPMRQEETQDNMVQLDISLDAEGEAEEIKKKNKKLEQKAWIKKVFILVLILVIIILLIKSCGGGTASKPDLEKAEYIEQGSYPEHVDGYTAIPVVDDFTVSKEQPYVTLYNPETNKGYSYLQYRFTDEATEKVIYESGLVEAGKKFSVAFGDFLDVGEYDVLVEILNFDYSDHTQRKNGGQSHIVVTVE